MRLGKTIMMQRTMYIFLVLFWLGIGLALQFREQVAPDWQPDPGFLPQIRMMKIAAFIFAAWNSFRYFRLRQKAKQAANLAEEYSRSVGPIAPRVMDESLAVEPDARTNKINNPAE
jgi:hypothetical protein